MKTTLCGLVIDAPGVGAETAESAAESAADVTIFLGHLGPFARLARTEAAALWYRSLNGDEAGAPDLEIRRLCGGAFWCVFNDRTEVVVDGDGTTVHATWVPPATLESTLAYLLAHFLALVLRLRGVVSLHGSVIAVHGQAIVLAGQAGAGKSTTAAALARRGFGVVADDIAALAERDSRFFVHPGYPNVMLLPTSVNALWGEPDALGEPPADCDKLAFDGSHPDFRWCHETLPVGAIYQFGPRRAGLARPAIQPLCESSGLMRLIASSSCSRLIERKLRGAEFETLGRLMRRVPVRMVEPPADIGRLDSVCDAILDDFHTTHVV